MLVNVLSAIYKHALKPIFFLFNPELVHEIVTSFGELIGGFPGDIFNHKDPILRQKILGINFESPVGLAAGFDYEARLTQVLAPLGFGFQTVGTITNLYYEGNPKPRLGRLPKSKSLMVYKGFKNRGAQWTVEKLEKLDFKIPL